MTGLRLPSVPAWRLPLFWAAMLLVFWAMVLAMVPASRRAPAIAATVRYTFNDHSNEEVDWVWRYTGARPGKGQTLRVYYRQASIYPEANAVHVVAYAGGKDRPDTGAALLQSDLEPAGDFFAVQYVEIPSWPAERELWIGLRLREKSAVWCEVGAMPHTGLALPAFTVRGKSFAQRQSLQAMGPISTRLVNVGDPPPSRARPFAFVVAFALCGVGPLWFLRGYRRWWIAAVALHTVLLWKVCEVLFPSQWLWGGFHQARLGTTAFWVGLAGLQLLLFPGVLKLLGRPWGAFSARGLRRWPRLLTVPALVLLAAIAYVLISRTQSLGLYGDAYGSLAIPGYDYHNPFATALYHAWKPAFAAWSKWRGTEIFPGFAEMNLVPRFVTLWAPLYVVGVGLIARQLGRSRREALLCFVALLLLKTTMTFYGYVEVYGPALAVQSLMIAALLAGMRRAGAVLPSVLAFFGYLFQMGGAMALPAIVVLWAVSFWRTERRAAWLTTRLAATIVLALMLWLNCLATLFVFKHEGKLESFNRHVPALEVTWHGEKVPVHGLAMLVGSTGRDKREVFLHWKERHYTHFYLLPSWEHANQVTGEILFVGGPILPLLLLAIPMARRRAWRTPEWYALLGAGGAFLLSAIFLSTNYPYPKDWDVFSLHSLWWTTALLLVLARSGAFPPAARRWLLAAVVLYLAWDTLPWIVYNLTWGPPASERNFVFF